MPLSVIYARMYYLFTLCCMTKTDKKLLKTCNLQPEQCQNDDGDNDVTVDNFFFSALARTQISMVYTYLDNNIEEK